MNPTNRSRVEPVDEQVGHEITEDGILVLTLNRPDKLNAVTWAMEQLLHEHLSAAESDSRVSAVVLTGAGDRFSAGYDIHELTRQTDEEQILIQVQREQLLWRWTTTPLPTVVALRGITYGVGALLAACADLRVAGRSTRFRVTAMTYGGVNLSWILTGLLGLSKAKQLVYLSDYVDADEGAQMGLHNWVVDDDQVLGKAMAVAARLAEHDSAAISHAKRLLNDSVGRPLFDTFQAENVLMRTELAPGPLAHHFDSFLLRRDAGT